VARLIARTCWVFGIRVADTAANSSCTLRRIGFRLALSSRHAGVGRRAHDLTRARRSTHLHGTQYELALGSGVGFVACLHADGGFKASGGSRAVELRAGFVAVAALQFSTGKFATHLFVRTCANYRCAVTAQFTLGAWTRRICRA